MSALGHVSREPGGRRPVGMLMLCQAASLALMSVLNLSGTLTGAVKPFDPSRAGVVEAIICLLLAVGATTLLRRPRSSGRVALATTSAAIVGFAVGLYFTIQGGDAIDLVYALTVLPLLLLTLLALLRKPTRSHP